MSTYTQTTMVTGRETDAEICFLLGALTLTEQIQRDREQGVNVSPVVAHGNPCDIDMASSPCQQVSSQLHSAAEPSGCALLQSLHAHPSTLSTTGGEYLDTIITHRAIFEACPQSHRDCAKGFADIARTIETRAWRADRDADVEAVAAFRYEAWMIAQRLTLT